jgi:hypothetical protein
LETYIFHEGPLAADTILDYEPAIFNTPRFPDVQTSTPSFTFHLLDVSRSIALAGIQFHVENAVARTPYKAPFGSIECSGSINPKLLYRFLHFIDGELKKKGIREVWIKNPPRAYSPELWSLVETSLLNQKFLIAQAEISAVIPVNESPFTAGIRHSEKLRLQQGREAGFMFRNVAITDLDSVFSFIAGCHRKKGYQVPIGLEELKNTAKEFPENYLLFAVFHQGKIVAASVSIRVKKNILYNFLANHKKVLNHLSPPVMLMEGMYEYCRKNSIGLMDLGTSALHGEPNFSLLDFKLHVGGRPTSKFSFTKKLIE